MFCGSWGSVAGIVTRLRAKQKAVRIPACSMGFSLLQNVQSECGAHPASYSMVAGVYFRGHKAARAWSRTTLCGAEVRNKWSHTSSHHICLHDLDRKGLPSIISSDFKAETRVSAIIYEILFIGIKSRWNQRGTWKYYMNHTWKYHHSILFRKWGKPREPWVKLAGTPAKTRMRYVSNIVSITTSTCPAIFLH